MIEHRLNLNEIEISKSTWIKLANRIGRRLLKNDKFLDKLADCLEGHQVSDTSELNEGEWGIDVE